MVLYEVQAEPDETDFVIRIERHHLLTNTFTLAFNTDTQIRSCNERPVKYF